MGVARMSATGCMTQALAFGAERGQPGGAFLLAFTLVLIALLTVVFGVVRKIQRAPEPA